MKKFFKYVFLTLGTVLVAAMGVFFYLGIYYSGVPAVVKGGESVALPIAPEFQSTNKALLSTKDFKSISFSTGKNTSTSAPAVVKGSKSGALVIPCVDQSTNKVLLSIKDLEAISINNEDQ